MEARVLEAVGIGKLHADGGRRVRALDGASLSVAPGELVVIAGRSGAGKSTLLSILGGLDARYEGEVRVEGVRLSDLDERGRARLRARSLGFVFQGRQLFPRRTVLENVMLPGLFAPGAGEARARELLERVGLGPLAGARAGGLSGGESQRVAIARALFLGPRLLLCDEPTGNLDEESAVEIAALFRRLAREGSLAVVVASHDPELWEGASRRLTLVDGRLVESPGPLTPGLPSGRGEGEGAPGMGAPPAPARRGRDFSFRLARFAIGDLSRDLAGALLLGLAIAAGAGGLFFFGGLGRGAARAVRRIFPDADRTIEIVPPALRLGGLFTTPLDDAAVARLRALPGVAAVERQMLLRVPASSTFRGAFFGAPLDVSFEVAAVGVDRGLIAPDLPGGARWEAPAGGPVPACISDRLLALYDTVFAPSRGLPSLSPSAVRGFVLPVTVGRSLVGPAAGPVAEVAARVDCVSPRAMLAGLTVPLPLVREWNRAAGRDAATYSSVALTARSADLVPGLCAAVERLGLAVDPESGRIGKVVGEAVALATLVFSALALLAAGLAAAAIGQVFMLSVRVRRREIGLLRALGAAPGGAAAFVLWQAAAVGLSGGVAGVALAAAAARAADRVFAAMLPAFPGRPETLFAFSPVLVAAALSLSLGAALAGAAAPARAAARLSPARALAQ